MLVSELNKIINKSKTESLKEEINVINNKLK